MTIKIGINGYGRIGRNMLRALYESDKRSELEICGRQRPRRRQHERASDAKRHGARALSGDGGSRRRQHDCQRRQDSRAG